MNAERILVASESSEDGRWFVEKAVTYCSPRVIFGKALGANQGVQFPITKGHMAVEAAALMCKEAAALFDSMPKSALTRCGTDLPLFRPVTAP